MSPDAGSGSRTTLRLVSPPGAPPLLAATHSEEASEGGSVE